MKHFGLNTPPILLLASSLAFCLSLIGCQEARTVPEDLRPENKLALKLETFPTANLLELGSIRGRVEADRRQLFHVPETGRLVLKIDQSEVTLSKGVVWAVMTPDSLQLEQTLLETRSEILRRKRALFESVESKEIQLQIEEALEETRSQLATIEALDELAADPAMVKDLLPQFEGLDLATSRKRLQSQTELLRLRQTIAESGGQVSAAELELAEVELRRSQLEFELRTQRFELTMPFDGLLQCNLDLQGKPESVFVEKGEFLGVAEDPNRISIKVEMRDSSWLAYVPESTRLITVLDGVREVGVFQNRSLRDRRGLTFTEYHFGFESEVNEQLRERRNSEVIAHLTIALKQASHIVPKLDLIERYPDLFRNGDWREGLSQLWPNAELVAVGSTDVAVLSESSK
jgi:hypothetical protein